VAEIACRHAELGEAADILALLMEVAPEIPVSVETLEHEEALYARIRNWRARANPGSRSTRRPDRRLPAGRTEPGKKTLRRA